MTTNLQMTGYVVPRERVDAHDLQYPGWHRLVDAQLLHGLDESPVKLWRPVYLQIETARGSNPVSRTLTVPFFCSLLGLALAWQATPCVHVLPYLCFLLSKGVLAGRLVTALSLLRRRC
jgi:hypothetical protein